MRILDLGEFYSERGGGVRSYLSAMLSASAARGHELVIVAPGPKDSDEAVEGGRVLRYRAPHMPYDNTYHVPHRVDVMRRWIRELQPDVLQLSSPYIPWLASRGLRVPVRSYVYHSDPIGAYLQPTAERLLPPWLSRAAVGASYAWMKSVCDSTDVTVVAGHWLQAELESRGVRSACAIPFGIEHDHFGPERRDSKLRAKIMGDLANVPEARLLVVAGRLAVEKRQALMLQAVAQVSQSRPIALLVLGDGPERKRLEIMAKNSIPVHQFLPFTKSREEYAEVLASADVLIHGSRCETYGFVLVEALASGTPLVVPAAGGAAHAGTPNCAELYAADAGVTEVATAIGRMLDRPRDNTRRAAVAAAAEHPSKQEHFDRLFDVYAERVKKGRR